MASYVAAYGENAVLLVAAERYKQRVIAPGRILRPRTLISEFALVRTTGPFGWQGFRDVVELDGEQIVDRRDRLQALLTGPSAAEADFRQIVADSARFNIGPVARNFNVPTTVLLFFQPSVISRFEFTRRGMKTVEGVEVVQLDFREVARPTLVMRRDGTDVPVEGSVWVVPADGTVVRTRVKLRNFADAIYMSAGDAVPRGARPGSDAPVTTSVPPSQPQTSGQPQPPAQPPTSSPPVAGPGTPSPSPPPGSGATRTTPQVAPPGPGPPDPPRRRLDLEDTGEGIQVLETYAEVEVTYRREGRFALWLPWRMSEAYQGPIPRASGPPILGRADCKAEYSNYRRFETSAKIVAPK